MVNIGYTQIRSKNEWESELFNRGDLGFMSEEGIGGVRFSDA